MRPPLRPVTPATFTSTISGRPRWLIAAGLMSAVAATTYLARPTLHPTKPPALLATPTATAPARAPFASAAAPSTPGDLLPGRPRVTVPTDLYAADQPGALSPALTGFRPLLYIPDSRRGSVVEVDPRTGALVRRLPVGGHPQRIVASGDRTALWLLNDQSNTITTLNPRDGSPGRVLPVTDPHNLYFTPDGRSALIVEQTRQSLAFRDPHTLALLHRLPVNCPGVDQLDFTTDGRYAIASCAFAHHLIKIDLARQQVVGALQLSPGSSPQDVKTTPDGTAMYIADPPRGGIWKINPTALRTLGFLATGRDAHGLYLSRDAQQLYITNRSSVSVLSFAANVVTHRWRLPRGSTELAGLSHDGTTLWLTGRAATEIYALDTRTGELRTRTRPRPPTPRTVRVPPAWPLLPGPYPRSA